MRVFFLSFVVMSFTALSGLAQRDGRPPAWSPTETWQARQLDPAEVQGVVDTLNEEVEKQLGKTFIVKYYLDLGPLNRVQINPDLWNTLSSRQQRDLGNKFAKAFRGSGLLFAQLKVGDVAVGKVRSDAVRVLKYEPVK